MRERNGCRTDLVLTKIEFDDYIVTSIRKLPLKELFFIAIGISIDSLQIGDGHI